MTLGKFENNPNEVGWAKGLPEVDEAIMKEIENSYSLADQKLVSCILDPIHDD
eukprot:CAMPEP_0116872512 /NCGR_PEP_ID=MMETSP0463-20121206/3284_1 /TAXON_ID=181622 /ORGANISM="Strombidinopsis sp, Strain SopsisLIS2011" /LENGTH=52 /DNA_ID=CAMNT_0004512851 /DNA_START=907 /DNA_END=1065 /DNA_ORIENTATION=-